MSKTQAKQLREERGKLIEEMKGIMARADKDGNLEQVDNEQWEKLDKRQEELKAQYTRMERQADIEAEQEARQLPGHDEANKPGEGNADLKQRYNDAFGRYIRSIREQDVPKEDLETIRAWKAEMEKRGTSTQVGSTAGLGGNLIPEGFANRLEKYLKMYGGVYEAADVIMTATGNPFPYPTVNDTASTGAYIDQGTADSVADVTFAKVDFPLTPTMTSKVIKVSWELMQDSFFDLEGLIAELAGERLGRFSNAQFTTGSTSGKIQGFITGSSSGKTAASATAFTRAELVDLMHSIDPAYRNSAKCRWMFNDTTLAAIKKLSFGTGDDRPLWIPSMREGAPDTLEGKPYTVNQDMASAATGTKPIAFGDFGKYKVRVAQGIVLEMSRERYWDERVTGFVALARMDGRLVNTDAIKFLTMA